jgi:hypothetical protein
VGVPALLSFLGSGVCVGFFEPGDELLVYLIGVFKSDAVGDHAVEAAGGFEAVGGVGAFEIDADIDASFCRWLNDGELLVSAEAYIGLFGGDLDVFAEAGGCIDDGVVDGAEVGFGAGVLGCDEVVGVVGAAGVGLEGFVGDEVGVAVGHAVVGFEVFEDLAVLFEFCGSGDFEPLVESFAGVGFHVVDHGLGYFFG